VFGDGKFGSRGRRLPGRALGVAALLAATLAPAFLSPATVHASPVVEVLSHSSWTESINGVTALHVIGQFRNDSTTEKATDVRIDFNLLAGGVRVGNSVAMSTVRILTPGEVSPFEEVLFPASASWTTTSIVDGSPAVATTSTMQAYQSVNGTPMSLTVTPCADPNLLSGACQDHVSGTVTNIGTVPAGGPVTADDVRVIFTFFDSGGVMVGQDTAMVSKADGSTALAPGESGSFALDRTGEPAWSGDTAAGLSAIAEPRYPLDANPNPLAFGKQRVGVPTVPLPVALTNLGQVRINISSLTTTGDFTLVHACTTIDPAQSCSATVSFGPTTMGDVAGTLVIASDAPGTAQVVALTGTGIAPVISLQPSSLAFDPQPLSTTSNAQNVTLANTGTAPMAINGTGVTGDFAQVHPGCGSTLAAGGNCSISVTFTPTGGSVRAGVLSVDSDAFNSSTGVALSGTGVGPIASFSPTALDFGDVAEGAISSKLVTLSNAGFGTNSSNGALVVSAVSTTAGFSEVDTCGTLPATLPPAPAAGWSCGITVTFAPTTPGPVAGTLTVRDGSGTNHLVSLTGNGLGPGLGLSVATVDFGGVVVGQTSPVQTVTLTSTGGAPLTITSVGPPSATDFMASDTCAGTTLTTGGLHRTCTISLSFQPAAAGPHPATLSIVDNAGNHQVALAGTGLSSQWEPFGGILWSGPGVSAFGSSQVDVFVRGQDSALWRQSWNGSSWSGWQHMGGIITSDPATVSWGVGRIDVLARGQDDALWHRAFDNGSWSGWESLGGILSSGPAVSTRGPGLLDVFVQGQDHQLWHRALSNNSWSGWEPLGGIITSDPAAASWGANRIDVFARGQDNALWHKSFDGNAWSGWDSQGGIVTFSPEATSWGTGRLDIFVIGQDRQLWHKAFDSGTWAGWQPLGGILTASPGAAARAVGVIDVFGRGQDQALWHRIVSGS
jgi:hypothetical protein